MNRTHVDLTDDQHQQLHEVARRRGRSLDGVIHEAIDLFLQEVTPEPEPAPGEEQAERAIGRPEDGPDRRS